ncbi:uncharacterized protein VDAG_09633 [Verticillium dahliae VdLs.17]|uniref:Uncharacterized protein n=2 Tax=Verticillium dahliae TaxID=27337 RepID=G2XHY3_VERDV|nr:uncharacterized protein VDAG_09633 [Verticillium dahliae VdLs.17]EGY19431.1 hypothetical protein VDAG_09633 [Verticillium dahliae VdLs.17]KAH6708643.1 hypothetical protein EV126DRAFT_484893 [Verticillium dahliae]
MYPNGSCQAAPDVILKNSLVLGQHHQEGMRMRRHALLYHFSLENNGLSTQKQANHLGWKYGPTAFVITILCWLLILLTVRVLKHPFPPTTDSSQTVFSTGLLVLEPTVIVREGISIPIQSTFDAQGYQIPQLGPAAAQLYYAINFQGLPYPMGTSADTVVPKIGLPDSPAQANYSVVNRGAKVGINGMFCTIDIATPECNISSAIVAAGPDSNHYVQENATQNFQGIMQDYTCNNGVEYSRLHDMTTNYTEEQVVNASMPHRVLLTMANLPFTPMNRSLTRPERIYIQDFTAALCTYNYTLDDFEVESLVEFGTRKQAAMQTTHHQGAHELEIPGFPKGMLGKSVEYATRLLDVGTGGVDFVLSTPVTSFFRLVTIKQNRTTIGDFMDPDLLISTASNVFKGVGTQLLGTVALNPAITSTERGCVTVVEDRLHVTELSTAFMCTFLSLTTILSLAVVFLRPQDVFHREPGSIAATAAVLASSPGLEKLLLGLGTSSQAAICNRLPRFNFRSSYYYGPEPAFVVESLDNGLASIEKNSRGHHKRDGLLDIGESDSLRFVTYVPAAVAIYLGGTYSSFGSMAATFAPYSILKQRNATPERSITLRLVGKLAPHALLDALKTRHFSVAIILAANFVGGFLTIVISGLYSAIPVNNTRTVMLQQADVIDLSAGNISLEDNQAAAITSLIEYIDLQSPQWTYDDLLFNTMHPITSPSKQDLSHEQPLSAMLQAVRPGLDCFTIPSNDRHIQVYNYTNGLTLMPGMTDVYPGRPGELVVQVNTTLRVECSRPLANSTSVSKDWLQYFVIPDKESVIHVGKACLLGWFDDTKIITWGDGATDTSPESGSGMGVEGITLGDSGRPSMAFTLGTVRASRSGRNEKARQFAVESDLATLVCYQRVDYVMANVTFSVPSVTIDTLVPPIRDESTRTVLVDPTTNTTSFAYPINRLLLSIANSLTANMTESDDIAILDGFSRALLSGRGAQPIETLAGEANVENLRKAVTRLYKTYMAQAISANMRRDAELLPAHEGRLTSSARRRLWYNVNNVKVQVTS